MVVCSLELVRLIFLYVLLGSGPNSLLVLEISTIQLASLLYFSFFVFFEYLPLVMLTF